MRQCTLTVGPLRLKSALNRDRTPIPSALWGLLAVAVNHNGRLTPAATDIALRFGNEWEQSSAKACEYDCFPRAAAQEIGGHESSANRMEMTMKRPVQTLLVFATMTAVCRRRNQPPHRQHRRRSRRADLPPRRQGQRVRHRPRSAEVGRRIVAPGRRSLSRPLVRGLHQFRSAPTHFSASRPMANTLSLTSGREIGASGAAAVLTVRRRTKLMKSARRRHCRAHARQGRRPRRHRARHRWRRQPDRHLRQSRQQGLGKQISQASCAGLRDPARDQLIV
jgi:hypothetical protein